MVFTITNREHKWSKLKIRGGMVIVTDLCTAAIDFPSPTIYTEACRGKGSRGENRLSSLKQSSVLVSSSYRLPQSRVAIFTA